MQALIGEKLRLQILLKQAHLAATPATSLMGEPEQPFDGDGDGDGDGDDDGGDGDGNDGGDGDGGGGDVYADEDKEVLRWAAEGDAKDDGDYYDGEYYDEGDEDEESGEMVQPPAPDVGNAGEASLQADAPVAAEAAAAITATPPVAQVPVPAPKKDSCVIC